jgi:hypothetical protein
MRSRPFPSFRRQSVLVRQSAYRPAHRRVTCNAIVSRCFTCRLKQVIMDTPSKPMNTGEP